jgi:hypothetical protein
LTYFVIMRFFTLPFLIILQTYSYTDCRSQWPRDLRHELSSSARRLRYWVRFSIEARMFEGVYSTCVVLRIGRGLATGWSPVQGSYRLRKLKK